MSEQLMAYEEVPGSRTLQQAVEQPQRERWAYEELQPGDVIEAGDQWQNSDGRWQALVLIPEASTQVRDSIRARRPHNITLMLAEFANQAEVLAEVRADEKRLFDVLELLRSEYAKLQNERDDLQTALCECRAAHKVTMEQGLQACKERDEACRERDLARAEVARLSTELWARKPLEDRVASLTDEVAQLRAERQEWIDRCNAESVRVLRLSEQLSAAEVAVKSAQRARDELQLQVDELRAGLMGVVSAEHVHSMLEDMLDQTEWVGQCLDSTTYEQMSCIQRTIANVAERVRNMVKEGASANT